MSLNREGIPKKSSVAIEPHRPGESPVDPNAAKAVYYYYPEINEFREELTNLKLESNQIGKLLDTLSMSQLRTAVKNLENIKTLEESNPDLYQAKIQEFLNSYLP